MHHYVTYVHHCQFTADPDPPTGVSVVPGTDCGTAAVSWSPSQVNYNAVIGNYSVRYRLRSSTGGYTTVYSSSTSVLLEGIDCSAEYTVEVAAIDSCGRISNMSTVMTPLAMEGTNLMQWYTVFPWSHIHANFAT